MARRPLTLATVKPIRLIGGGGMSARLGNNALGGVIQLQLDQKAIARAQARLENFRDKPLHVRMDKATKAAAELLVAPMRAAAPKRTGRLRASVKARTGPNHDRAVIGAGFQRATGGDRVGLVGPKSPIRHLIIRGHRIVTPGGRDTGRRTSPNPFVDNVAARHQARALQLMREYIVTAGLNQGVGTAVLYGRGARRTR